MTTFDDGPDGTEKVELHLAHVFSNALVEKTGLGHVADGGPEPEASEADQGASEPTDVDEPDRMAAAPDSPDAEAFGAALTESAEPTDYDVGAESDRVAEDVYGSELDAVLAAAAGAHRPEREDQPAAEPEPARWPANLRDLGRDTHPEPDPEPDTQRTDEHFFGPLVAEPRAAQISSSSARRIADLTSQIDFLDIEVSRYRELLEADRIRHTRQLSELALDADARLDDLRRHERQQTQQLHDSHRTLLAQRQVEFEEALSRSASEHAAELAAERERHEEILEHERTRREVHLEASRKQMVDELSESHSRARQLLVGEAEQARTTIGRLRAEIDELNARSASAESTVKDQSLEILNLTRRVESSDQQRTSQVDELEAQLEVERRRVIAERQRSAATLTELLEHSAAIAAETDTVRAEAAANQATSEHAAAAALHQAQADYAALAGAADDRAEKFAVREAELESAIAALRAELGR